MAKKFSFIKQYQGDCLMAPPNLGGEAFTSRTGHSGGWGSVGELVYCCGLHHKHSQQDGKKEELYTPGVYGFDFWLAEKDVLAYKKFQEDNVELKRRISEQYKIFTEFLDNLYPRFSLSAKTQDIYFEHMENSSYGRLSAQYFDLFKDFAINYLNIAKVGTHDVHNRFGKKVIVTTDHTPHIRFEKWIKDGFHIHQLDSRLDFDVDRNEFVPKEPTLLQISADRNKREELEELLGKKLPSDDSILLSHSRFKPDARALKNPARCRV